MPSEEFVQELKSEFERLIHLKERLDNKANNMITMSGTVATLFMGFGIFLLTEVYILSNLYLGIPASLVLISEIFLTFCTIHSSLDSYKLRNYYHPILSGPFFDDNKSEPNGCMDEFLNADSKEIQNHFTKEYLKSIKSYEEENRDQTFGINKSQKTFLISLVMIPIFSIFVIAMVFFNT